MRKSKVAYMNYICPYCWHTLNNCTCSLFPPYHLIFIDKNIQEHVRILNEKGYRTIGCCEGHDKGCVNTYIAFAKDYFNDADVPEGFVYNKRRRMVTCSYSTKLTKKDMEDIKKKKLESLLEWCNGLPKQNTEN